MLIDITDARDVLILAFPARGATSREVSEAIVKECLDAASFFEPAGVVLDLSLTANVTAYVMGAVVHLIVVGNKKRFRVAVVGPEKAKVMLDACRLTHYLAGVYATREEAVDALRLPPRAA